MKNRSAPGMYVRESPEIGDSLLTLRILRPLRLGVCGEFSDYSFESLGWASGRTRVAGRPNALCQHPDFKRSRLDQSNETLGRARPQTRHLRKFIRAAGRKGLADHRKRSAISSLARSTSLDWFRIGADAGNCYNERGPVAGTPATSTRC